LRKTELALLVRLDDHDNDEVWIPFSVIHDDSDLTDDSEEEDEGLIVIAGWFAKKEGYDVDDD